MVGERRKAVILSPERNISHPDSDLKLVQTEVVFVNMHFVSFVNSLNSYYVFFTYSLIYNSCCCCTRDINPFRKLNGLQICHSPVNNQEKCSKPARFCVYISLFVHGNDLLRSKSSSMKSVERSGSALTLPPLTLPMWPSSNGDLVDSGIAAIHLKTAASHIKMRAGSEVKRLQQNVWINLL